MSIFTGNQSNRHCCANYSLRLLVTLIIVVETGMAEFDCYSTGGEKSTDKLTIKKIKKVQCDLGCYEYVKPPYRYSLATKLPINMYAAGCGDCPDLPYDGECNMCDTPLCNNYIAEHVITSRSLLCYRVRTRQFGEGDKRGTVNPKLYGKDRVWCEQGKECLHYTRSESAYGPKFAYDWFWNEAACYTTPCPEKDFRGACFPCKKWLCNLPRRFVREYLVERKNSTTRYAGKRRGRRAATGGDNRGADGDLHGTGSSTEGRSLPAGIPASGPLVVGALAAALMRCTPVGPI